MKKSIFIFAFFIAMAASTNTAFGMDFLLQKLDQMKNSIAQVFATNKPPVPSVIHYQQMPSIEFGEETQLATRQSTPQARLGDFGEERPQPEEDSE